MTVEGREVATLSWGDADFRGFSWEPVESGANLRLYLSPTDRPRTELLCELASDLKAVLDYGAYVGSFPSWDVTFEELPKNRWRVSIELSPVGKVTFECNNLRLEPGVNSPAA
jgi:hypothetical protein